MLKLGLDNLVNPVSSFKKKWVDKIKNEWHDSLMQLLSIVSKHLSIPEICFYRNYRRLQDLQDSNFKLPERRLRINESPIAINLKKNVLENSKTVDAKYYLKFSTNFKSSDHLV